MRMRMVNTHRSCFETDFGHHHFIFERQKFPVYSVAQVFPFDIFVVDEYIRACSIHAYLFSLLLVFIYN